jgi:hypothetical protein
MKIDFDGEEYHYDFNNIDVESAIVIKEKTDWGLKTWAAKLDEWEPLAWQMFYWVMLRQSGIHQEPLQDNIAVVKLITAVNTAWANEVEATRKAEASRPKGPPASSSRSAKTTSKMPTSEATVAGTSSS